MSHSSRHDKAHEPQRSTAGSKPFAGRMDSHNGQPAIDHIRLRAYEISQVRGDGPGDAQGDWAQAEAELKTAHAAKR